jgi:hypothetical protein
MDLFNYYNLDECLDKTKILKKLDDYKNDGKIEWSLEGEILKIQDLDLEEGDIENLEKLFDKLDIFPYTEYDDENGDDGFFSDEEDEFN